MPWPAVSEFSALPDLRHFLVNQLSRPGAYEPSRVSRARDGGRTLGTYAHFQALRRTAAELMDFDPLPGTARIGGHVQPDELPSGKRSSRRATPGLGDRRSHVQAVSLRPAVARRSHQRIAPTDRRRLLHDIRFNHN